MFDLSIDATIQTSSPADSVLRSKLNFIFTHSSLTPWFTYRAVRIIHTLISWCLLHDDCAFKILTSVLLSSLLSLSTVSLIAYAENLRTLWMLSGRSLLNSNIQRQQATLCDELYSLLCLLPFFYACNNKHVSDKQCIVYTIKIKWNNVHWTILISTAICYIIQLIVYT